MSTATVPQATLLTADAYFALPADGRRTELVSGSVVEMPSPGFRHGVVCSNVDFALRLYLRDQQRGRVVVNDAGIVTERNPDTVRGPDVAYYSFERLPQSEQPATYSTVAPEFVVEVLSPSDRWKDVLKKIGELLNVGVQIVLVIDPERQSGQIFYDDQPVRLVQAADTLEFPTILPGFQTTLALLLA